MPRHGVGMAKLDAAGLLEAEEAPCPALPAMGPHCL